MAILQSPPGKIGNKSNKSEVVKFLGYDWSNRKGDEGIKYVTNTNLPKQQNTDESEDKDDKDVEIANAINSIKYIATPLYNPDDDYDASKFSYALRKHIRSQCEKFSFPQKSQENESLVKEFSNEMSDDFEIPVYNANVFEPFGKIDKLLLKDFSVPSILCGIDGDWQVNVIPKNQQFYPTDHCGVIRIKNNQLEAKYAAYVLEKKGESEGFRRQYRASIDRIEALSLKLPPLSEQ